MIYSKRYICIYTFYILQKAEYIIHFDLFLKLYYDIKNIITLI